MNKFVFPVVIGSLILTLGACENRPKTAMGTILGGSALGGASYYLAKGSKYSKPIALAGVAVGALLGNALGESLDKQDEMHHLATTQLALETKKNHEVSGWKNPNKKSSGEVTPVKTFKNAVGQHCRDYKFHVIHDQIVSSGTGTACRNPKTGVWEHLGIEKVAS